MSKKVFQHKREEYNMDDQNRILAGLILNCKPEDLKGIAQKADGSLAVVAPNGMKFVFSPVELDNARDSFCLPAVSPLASTSSTIGDKNIIPDNVSILFPEKPIRDTTASSVTGSGLITGSTTHRNRRKESRQ
jgi:hypothetical protein